MARPSMAASAFSVVGGLPGSGWGVPECTPEGTSPVGAPVARPPPIQYGLRAQDAVWLEQFA
eukprot:8770504-Lingulodinium_polyedra.AAC.1